MFKRINWKGNMRALQNSGRRLVNTYMKLELYRTRRIAEHLQSNEKCEYSNYNSIRANKKYMTDIC